jgi:hypothetical protein
MQITIKVPLTSDTDARYTIRDIIRIDYITSVGSYPSATQMIVYHKNTASNQKTIGQLCSLVEQALASRELMYRHNSESEVVYYGKLNLGDVTFTRVWISENKYDIENDCSVTTLRADFWTVDNA